MQRPTGGHVAPTQRPARPARSAVGDDLQAPMPERVGASARTLAPRTASCVSCPGVSKKRACQGAGRLGQATLAGPVRTAGTGRPGTQCAGAGGLASRARGAAQRMPSSARLSRGAATVPLAPWRAHGPERKRDRRGHGACLKRLRAFEGRPARGHDRVGAPARARLRPGLQPARGAFLLRGLVRPVGWDGWAVSHRECAQPPWGVPIGRNPSARAVCACACAVLCDRLRSPQFETRCVTLP